jgi:hypothetical protein
MSDESLLKGVEGFEILALILLIERAERAQAFYCQDGFPMDFIGLGDAGSDGNAIDENDADVTIAFATTDFRASQV